MNVIKANGDRVLFDKEKIRSALLRVQTRSELAEKVIEAVSKAAYDDITTKELYQLVFRELKRLRTGTAGKFHLKRAIMELGPTGFPFEKFIAAVWVAEGFAAETNQIVKGDCVDHEIDVIAQKYGLHYMMECKFHNQAGKVCDLKTSLYVQARFLDVEKTWKKIRGHKENSHKGWLITNMRFTSEAIKYGTCSGLGLMSWDYPAGESLRERIDRGGLHPITCLTSLTNREKQLLLKRGVVLCTGLCSNQSVLSEIGVLGSRLNRVIEEARLICQTT